MRKRITKMVCAVFGHTPRHTASGLSYGKPFFLGRDGLGTDHWELRVPCHRCGEVFEAGRYHTKQGEKGGRV